MAENIISIEDLSKSFGDHEVLRKIDISVDKGEVICIVGSSGSGKSTLLRCITGWNIRQADGSSITEKKSGTSRERSTDTGQRWAWYSSLSTCSTI